MIGPEGACELLEAALLERIIGVVRDLELELGRLLGDNGDPLEVSVEPQLITCAPLPPEAVPEEQWPFVSITPRRVEGLRLHDRSGSATQWRAAYPVQAMVWVRSTGYRETAIARNRLVTALVQCLLAYPALSEFAVVPPDSVGADLSPVGDDATLQAIVAAARIDATVVVDETIPQAGAVSAAPDGWDSEVDADLVGYGDTLGLPGGPAPDGAV